ncbi:MAG: hypothetical protein ACLVK4_12145 [Alistipes shahii]|uniref:hypothetical protein n=1 Tax=Alistipes shahii TaxID=328814 RepID=UPI00399CB318
MGVIHEVLERLGLDIPIAGLAKDDRHRTAELLCGFPPVLVGIRPTSPLFHFLSQIQEEVHRFAIAFPPSETRARHLSTASWSRSRGSATRRSSTLPAPFTARWRGPSAAANIREELSALVGPAKAKKSRLSSKNRAIF